MKRVPSKSVAKRNTGIVKQIKSIKSEHPLWGYRRIWAYLKYRQKIAVNKKRVYRLMSKHGFLVTKQTRLKAKRYCCRPKPRASRPNEFWGIDMTKIKIATWGWLYLTVVLDWYSKEIIGYNFSFQSKTADWLKALNKAVKVRFPEGIRETAHDISLISDNGCQPTSEKFMSECSALGLKQIFTTWGNPKGNSDTERVLRTMKEDLVWIHDWDNPFDFEKALDKWITDYNIDFPHQTLKYMTPREFLENYFNEHNIVPSKTSSVGEVQLQTDFDEQLVGVQNELSFLP